MCYGCQYHGEALVAKYYWQQIQGPECNTKVNHVLYTTDQHGLIIHILLIIHYHCDLQYDLYCCPTLISKVTSTMTSMVP